VARRRYRGDADVVGNGVAAKSCIHRKRGLDMSVPHQQSHTPLARRWRHVSLAAAILMCAGLGACTAEGPPTAAPAEPAVAAIALPSHDADLDAGTYLSTRFAVPFEVTVPDGWTYIHDRVLRKDVGDTEGVFVWFGRASHVPSDACEWSGRTTAVGPSVEALADALAAQTSTATSALSEVTMGEYSGLGFDFSVEGVDDLSDCSGSKICIHSESISCTRWYNSSVAQRETYRVLDLDGDRAILTVGEFDDKTDAALVAEAQAVFDSITFVSE
jgi:hypothetical protein